MEVILERLLVEVLAIAVQLALWRLLEWSPQALVPRQSRLRRPPDHLYRAAGPKHGGR